MNQHNSLPDSSQRVWLVLLNVVILLICTVFPASASADNETDKINTIFNGSRFAQSVAITSNSGIDVEGFVAVIGASEENDRFASTGAAYIYRNMDGDWRQEARLVLDDRRAFDRFGWSVAASGEFAVVGSNGSGQQTAVIYRFIDNEWYESATLTPTSDEVFGFGRNVAISGDVAIIGAQYSTTDGVSTAGAAFVYRFNGTTWVEEAALSPNAPRDSAQFGSGVAIHGDVAVVGAPATFSTGSQGSVYVYRFNGTSWVEEAVLAPTDDAFEDRFGTRVAIYDNTIAVGSPFDDSVGEDSGSAYVFRFEGTTWTQDTKLIPSDGGSFEYFGSDVALSTNIIVVGVPGDDDNGRDSGSAYKFRNYGSGWIQESKLTASDASENARLGNSVSIFADVALIGASGDRENGIISGAAYTFDVFQDTDGDGVSNTQDNCPIQWNPMQEDFDVDGIGDICDVDDDSDGLADEQDPAPYDSLISIPPTPASPSGDNIAPGVDFEWAELPGSTRYAIEIQHDGQIRVYDNMILASVACRDGRCRYAKPDAALEGVNRWRLRAGTNAGGTYWSAWTEFTVDGGTGTVIDEGEPGLTDPEALAIPQTTSPSGPSYSLGVDYKWARVSGATNYTIEIQHNGEIRGYASMLDAELLCNSSECVYTKTDAALIGENRWRLKAGNSSGSTAWSPWTEFTVTQSVADVGIPAIPVLNTPIGSVANPSAEYQWLEVNGATRYAIEIQHNGLIRGYADTIDASAVCSAANCRYVKSDAALVGENRWRLRAGSAAGFSQWSGWQYFVVE